MTQFISWIILLIYVIACFFYWRGFSFNRTIDYLWAQRFLALALIFHLSFLAFSTLTMKRIPIANIGEVMGTLVWLTACIYFVLEIRLKNFSMGAFILSILSVLMLIGNLTFRKVDSIAEVLQDVRFETHVLALLIAYGSFSISFIASLLHTLLDREIQKRRFSVFYSRLPSLPFFQRISNSAIDIGLVFATIGISIGIYQALVVWEEFFLKDPKIIAAIVTWLIYCVHFFGRRFTNWGAQRTATLSLIGFSSLMISFLIISTFASMHNFTVR